MVLCKRVQFSEASGKWTKEILKVKEFFDTEKLIILGESVECEVWMAGALVRCMAVVEG